MKTFDVLLCQRKDLENEKSFTELENLKTVEIKASSYEDAEMKAHQEHSSAGWVILTCEERHYVKDFENFTVTD